MGEEFLPSNAQFTRTPDLHLIYFVSMAVCLNIPNFGFVYIDFTILRKTINLRHISNILLVYNCTPRVNDAQRTKRDRLQLATAKAKIILCVCAENVQIRLHEWHADLDLRCLQIV